MSDVHGIVRDSGQGSQPTIQHLHSGSPHTSLDVSFSNGVLRLTVDQFEQRRLYWRKLPDDGGIEFASRIDLLRKSTDAICLEALSCQWTQSMSVSERSLFQEINRVPAGKTLVYDGRTVQFENNEETLTPADPNEVLLGVLRSLRGRDVVLGLSGGFDSRTLMAALHGAEVPFRVHTYGTRAMPDVGRARDVSVHDGVSVIVSEIDKEEWDVHSVLTSLRKTAWQSEGTYPGVHALVFDNADVRLGPKAVLVDGGYGALLRGGFGNSLIVRASRALTDRHAEEVVRHLGVRGCETLHPDVQEAAHALTVDAMQSALDAMPAYFRQHSRQWIDEFFLRWNPRGYTAAPQAVYDARLNSAPTFLDEDVVRAVFNSPIEFRSNGRWFRSMISKWRPNLRSHAMVGKSRDVPWALAGRPMTSAIWSRLLPSYPEAAHGAIERHFYALLRPVIMDLSGSIMSSQFDVWDMNEIQRLAAATSATEGTHEDRATLLLWLGYRLMADTPQNSATA